MSQNVPKCPCFRSCDIETSGPHSPKASVVFARKAAMFHGGPVRFRCHKRMYVSIYVTAGSARGFARAIPLKSEEFRRRWRPLLPSRRRVWQRHGVRRRLDREPGPACLGAVLIFPCADFSTGRTSRQEVEPQRSPRARRQTQRNTT